MLNIGDTVTIKVRNVMYDVRHRYPAGMIPEFNEYTGTVMREKFFADDEIGITSDTFGIKFRRIRLDRIVEVNAAKVEFTPVKHERETKVVQGSKGNSYIVTRDGSKTTCTCPGYGFRKTCKHVHEAFA